MAADLDQSSDGAATSASLEIAEGLRLGRIRTSVQLEREKKATAVKYGLGRYLSNSDSSRLAEASRR